MPTSRPLNALTALWQKRILPFLGRLTEPHPDITGFEQRLTARVLASLTLAMLLIYFIPEGIRILVSPTAALSRAYILTTALAVAAAYGLSRSRRPLLGAWVLLLPLMIGPAIGLFTTREMDALAIYHNVSWGILGLLIGALLLPGSQFFILFLAGLGIIVGAAAYRGFPAAWVAHPITIFTLVSFILLLIASIRSRFLERVAESEMRFRELFNSTMEALVIHNGQRILAVNPAFEEMFRCPAEEAIGKAPIEFVAPRDRERAYAAFLENQNTPRARLRGIALRPDGSEFIASAMSAPITFAGKPALALSLRDVTEQIQAAKALSKERDFLQNILESIHDPFYVIDASTYRLLIANSAARAKGVPTAATCFALSHHRDTPCSGTDHPCPLQQVMRTHEPYTVEHIHYHADGTPYYVEVHGYPIRDENGKVVQMVEYAVDITARKKAEAEIRKLQQAVEQSDNAIVITDRDGTIEYVNPAFTRITGYSPEEAIGQNPRILKSGYHPQEFYAEMWNTLLRGEIWHGEVRNRRKDGRLYWESETISPVIGENGVIEHFIAIKEDITDRKEAEEERRKLQRAIEQSAHSVVITDRDGTIEYVNPAFTRNTGYTFEEAVGQNPRILKSGRHPQEFYRQMWETILGGEVWQGELVNRRKNGELYWEQVSIAPVRNNEGEVTHFVAVKEDITERKRLEEALQKANLELTEANRFKTQLLGNVSHDMRTPLGGIMGFTEMMLDGALGPVTGQQRHALQRIFQSAQQLVDFTSDLLNQAELESGRLRLNITLFSPQELLKVVPSSEALAEAKGLKLHTEIAPNLPEQVYGDPYWLRQIIANLLSNAVKFTEKGDIWLRIYGTEGERWAIEVEDTGTGIPKEAQEAIFEAFRQVDGSPTRRQKGSGLGLSIVKRLVELMGGEIRLESAPGKGSKFTVELPCQAQLLEEEPHA